MFVFLQQVGGSGVQLILRLQQLPSWNNAAAGIWSVKLKDPQGHPLELLQFRR